MQPRSLLLISFFVVAVITILNYIGIVFSLYWHFWWLDIPVHFLGGVGVAFGVAWLLTLRGIAPTLVTCIGLTLLVGLAWELFEIIFTIVELPEDLIDIISDLVFDAAGALAAVALMKLRSKQSDQQPTLF